MANENTYFYLYRNSKGVLDYRVISFIGDERKLREKLKKAGCWVEKVYNVNRLKEKATKTSWSRAKLLKFTKFFRLELMKANAEGNGSERVAMERLMKYIFDPVIYTIYTELADWREFKDIIKNFPNIFDSVYQGVIQWFFGGNYDKRKGLEIIIQNIQEGQEYKANLIKKSGQYLAAFALGISAAYLLDLILYDSLVSDYAQYGKYVPDFTQYFHEYLWLILTLLPIVVLFVSIGLDYLKNTDNRNVKIWFSKFLLGIPVIGPIIRYKAIYSFVDVFTLLKLSDQMMLWNVYSMTIDAQPNYYVKQIFTEIFDQVTEGKTAGDEMEEYEFFDNEDDVIKVFKWDLSNKFELETLQEITKEKFNENTNASFTKVLMVVMVFAVSIIFWIMYAYIMPMNQKTGLIGQQINEQRMDEYLQKQNK